MRITPIKGSEGADYVFWKKSDKSASGIFFSGPHEVIQKDLDLPQLCLCTKNVQTRKFPSFFSEKTRISAFLEGLKKLSSSIGWRVMAECERTKIFALHELKV